MLKGLIERKSVRIFEEKQVPKEVQLQLLEAAFQAPTAGNMQMYTIINITDQKLKDKLAISCDHQEFIKKAPIVYIFCADYKKWFDLYHAAGANPRKPGPGDLMLAINDALIAAQNMVVAAQELGLGSCYIGDIMENASIHKEMLNLPRYVFPAAMLIIGYPTASQKERIKPQRFAMEDMVCENTYQEKSPEMLRQMFGEKAKAKGFEEWVKDFCNRKYNSDFSKKMSRSVAEYLKEWDFSPEK